MIYLYDILSFTWEIIVLWYAVVIEEWYSKDAMDTGRCYFVHYCIDKHFSLRIVW